MVLTNNERRVAVRATRAKNLRACPDQRPLVIIKSRHKTVLQSQLTIWAGEQLTSAIICRSCQQAATDYGTARLYNGKQASTHTHRDSVIMCLAQHCQRTDLHNKLKREQLIMVSE
jgi:hypothetical protein